MRERNYPQEFAERIYQQMLGFGEYGFPECVVGETRVVDAACGRWLTIDEIVSAPAPLATTIACDDELRLQRRAVVDVKASGVKPVWRLRTALGHEIMATAEHPFLTPCGWCPLGELRPGDHVAAVRSLPKLGRRRWRRQRVLVLADLIAQRDGCDARTKCLPAEVFELCDSQLALLLARLWESDGKFSAAGSAAYATQSERLGIEIQHLLLRLGILACRHRRRRRSSSGLLEHEALVVSGEDLRRFWRLIGARFRDPKKRRLAKTLAAAHAAPPAASRAACDVHWDRIVAIEALGPRATYDLQVDRNHSFLANNLIVHNSHAASFALLVYDSSWLKCYEPAAFTCALLNSQPMGFYAPAQLVRDARVHGVEVRAVDVCASGWQSTPRARRGRGAGAAPRDAPGEVALGSRRAATGGGACAARVCERAGSRRARRTRSRRPRGAGCRRGTRRLERQPASRLLAGRRHRAVAPRWLPVPLAEEGRPLLLPCRPRARRSSADYGSFGLTLGRHPLALLRAQLQGAALCPAAELAQMAHGTKVRTAGIVIMRQRPGTASGVTFVTLEDESGQVNIIVWERIGREQRAPLLESRLLEVHGELQHQEGVMHVIAQRLIDRTRLLGSLVTRSRDFH